MTEDFLQFIWKHQLFTNSTQYSSKGEKIEIVEVGRQNFDAGPDFFDARIKINDMLWAGNVEIHVKSSSWYKHGHHNDPAYDSVILHVVFEDDADVTIDSNRTVPCICLDFEKDLYLNYESLMKSDKWIPCFDEIRNMDQFFVRSWLDRMLFERLERKALEIIEIYKQNSNSWEETLYQIIARYFGMKVNAEPFQQLARSIPLKFFAKQKVSLLQIEALLFGQAGMLGDDTIEDDYYKKLRTEFQFLQRKYKLTPMSSHRWKLFRLRPVNFPAVRIALFAKLIYNSNSLFSKIISCKTRGEMTALFELGTSDYWETHYRFGVESDMKVKTFGKQAADILIINALVPVLFAYGHSISNQDLKDKACEILEEVAPEKNNVIENWKNCGVKIKNAFHSQALLQLKENYCQSLMCLQCEFGNRIIRLKNRQSQIN